LGFAVGLEGEGLARQSLIGFEVGVGADAVGVRLIEALLEADRVFEVDPDGDLGDIFPHFRIFGHQFQLFGFDTVD